MLPLSPTSIGRPEASRAASLFSQTASPLALSPALYFSYDAVLLRRFQLRDHLEQEKKERARLLKEQVEDREADLEEFRLFHATRYSRRLPPPTSLEQFGPPASWSCVPFERTLLPLRSPSKDGETNLRDEDESTAVEMDEVDRDELSTSCAELCSMLQANNSTNTSRVETDSLRFA